VTGIALLAALGLPACIHYVEVQAVPAGATLLLGERRAPARVAVPAFGRTVVTASLPGYRSVDVDLSPEFGGWQYLADALTFRWRRNLGLVSSGTVLIRMERDAPTVTGRE
jgi:hypothetical protein